MTEIENALVRAVQRKSDALIEEDQDWFRITTPSSKHFSLNGVMRSRLKSNVAESMVAKVVHDYRERKLAFRWMVGPTSRPHDLGKMLEANGVDFADGSIGMAADSYQLNLSIVEGITIQPLKLANLDDYVRASLSGGGNPLAAEPAFRMDMDFILRQSSDKRTHFIA